MPIEFHCSSCQQFLRVPDDAAGKQAKCPKCQQVLSIPQASSAAPPGGGFAPLPSASAPPPSPYSAPPPKDPLGGYGVAPNPYASPSASQMLEPATYKGGEIRPTPLDIGKVLNVSWAHYQREFGLAFGVTLLFALIAIVINLPLGMAQNFLQIGAMLQGGAFAMLAVQVVFYFIGLPIQMFLIAGQMRFFLNFTRRQRAEIGDLFTGMPYVGRLVVASLIVNGPFVLAIFSIGAAAIAFRQPALNALNLLVYIPFIYVLFTYGQFGALIVDRDLSATDALQTSAQITPGSRLSLFALGLIMGLLMIAGVIACLVGVLFVFPLMLITPVVGYRQMIGENIDA